MIKEVKEVDEARGIVRVTIADERWYIKTLADGSKVYVPSVTWVAGSYPKGKEFYMWLASKGWDESQAVKAAAGDKGSKVHEAISDCLAGVEVRIDSEYYNRSKKQQEELTLEECEAILSFVNWRKLVNPTSLAWDNVLFSDKYNYAGTIDYACKLSPEAYKLLKIDNYSENDYWIIDFKSGQNIWTEYELQVSAYKQAQQETGEITGIPKNANIRTAILQVGYRKNKAGWKFTEMPDKFDLFLHARAIWHNDHGGEQPNLIEFPIVLSEGMKVKDIQI